MKSLVKFILCLGITIALAGCKLAVIVVEGGEVISDGSGTCMAGSICIVEVTDTNFEDVFEPVPNTGWYFHSWNLGDRFLCGGAIYPPCSLSFQGYEESEAVEEMVASTEMFYLMPIFKQIQTDIIEVDGRAIKVEGKEWLQPVDFTNHSYNQISAVCPDGVCSGTLPGSAKDLTGYMWASSDDVLLLFQAYRKAGRAILEDFENTASDLGSLLLLAILSDLPYEDPVRDEIYIALSLNGDPPELEGEVNIVDHFGTGPSENDHGYGVWFWRPID
jgi:hypothetical protein